MTRQLLAVAAVALLASPALAASDTYGAGVKHSEVTPIRDVIERPGDFEGKTVRIEGVVTAVCAHMGCWMALAPADAPDGPTVRLKVDDGVIVFPVSAKGRRAEAEGVVQRVGGDDAEGSEAAAEHAKGTGRAATMWQIKATGAVVH
ncbi:MAG TPA: DUF4920 domain-containing protein [Vicinamibacterales bacterium]